MIGRETLFLLPLTKVSAESGCFGVGRVLTFSADCCQQVYYYSNQSSEGHWCILIAKQTEAK